MTPVRQISFLPTVLEIDPRTVARLGRCGPDGRWSPSIQAAIDEARSLLSPRARWRSLSRREISNGLFPAPTPVKEIAGRGPRWAFVATIGSVLEARVKEHFEEGEFLEGVLLDAAGSAAVESLCARVEGLCAGEDPSSRYSPGYCSWQLTGQRRLFELLQPEESGIQLLPSLLMHPLKSVSGIIVQAEPEALTVPRQACARCEARGCTRRQAAPAD